MVDNLIPKMEAYNKSSTKSKVCFTFQRNESWCDDCVSPARWMGDYGEGFQLTIIIFNATEAKSVVDSLVMLRDIELEKKRSLKDKDVYSWNESTVQEWLAQNGIPSTVYIKLEGFDGKMLAEVTDGD